MDLQIQELKQSYIFDFPKEHLLITLDSTSITGIHKLNDTVNIGNIVYDSNYRITTKSSYIIEILYSNSNSIFLYRLLPVNEKIRFIIDAYGTKETYQELVIFLNYVVNEVKDLKK